MDSNKMPGRIEGFLYLFTINTNSKQQTRVLLLSLLLPLLPAACGSPNTPLDAKTLRAIDSISTAQINLARTELDSLCQQQRVAEMPRLLDSIRQIRMREIQEKLKNVPR